MLALVNNFKGLIVTAAIVTVGMFVSNRADAQTSCVNDDDCPEPACGGQVCDWITKGLTCQPAGGAAKGADGWCTTTDDCKCRALGATCVGAFCTFTLPSQAPGAATGGASGSTGGASGSTGGASGNTGGATGSTGGATGSDAGAKPSDSGGGCAIAGGAPSPLGSSSGLFGALAALAAMAIVGRGRRRTRP